MYVNLFFVYTIFCSIQKIIEDENKVTITNKRKYINELNLILEMTTNNNNDDFSNENLILKKQKYIDDQLENNNNDFNCINYNIYSFCNDSTNMC